MNTPWGPPGEADVSRVGLTFARGFSGALRGLVILVIGCLAIAPIPTAVTSLANRGRIDLDSFLPHHVTSATSPSRLVRIEATTAEQVEIRESLDSLVWPVDPKSFTIRVVPHGTMPDDPGMYLGPQHVIEIDAEVADDPIGKDLSHLLAHEIGHSLDLSKLDDQGRASFRKLRGIDPRQDWEDGHEPWNTRPQEDFAEVFAALDSPASVTPIRTFGGRMADETALRTLMARYQPGPMRPRETLSFSAVASLAALELGVVLSDTLWASLLFALALANAMFSALRAMRPGGGARVRLRRSL